MTLSLLESLPRNQLLALLEALDVSFFVKRADSVLLHISPLCAQAWGISIESVLGTRGEGVFPEDQIIGFMAKDQAVFAAGKAEQFEEFFWSAPHRSNRLGRTTKIPTFDETGQPALLFCLTEDITDVTQIKKALQASEHQYQTLVSELQIGVLTQDANGDVLLCNDKAMELLGMAKDPLLGKMWTDLDWSVVDEDGAPLPPAEYPSNKASRTLKPVRDVLLGVNRPRAGDRVWLQVQAEPVLLADATLSRVVVSFVDVTDLRAARQQAREKQEALLLSNQELARSNADLQQFAYAASHDLQEPLRSVASCVQILKKRYGGHIDGHADEIIAHAVDGALRMQGMINDLLSFSRIASGPVQLVAIDSRQAFDVACLNLTQARAEAQATITVGALPTVVASLSQLTQLLQNLIGNALKFRGDQAAVVHVDARCEANECVFTVTDHGIGLEEKYAERIFQLFQRLHSRDEYAGTGIGLTLCQKIVQRHGGRIWVESEPGVGTTFFFTIPKAPD